MSIGGFEHYLQNEREQIKRRLAAERGTAVITLIDHREPWSKPQETSITIEDSEYVLNQLRQVPPNMPVDFIIHTPGGLALAAEMIAHAVRLHPAPVTAMVPFYAMSGGTLIALAADVICMEPFSVLGPVDPQIGGFPSLLLIRLAEMKDADSIDDKMLILSEIARMARKSMMGFVQRLVSNRLSPEMARELADFMTGGHLTHDTPITLDVVEQFGLRVQSTVPPLVFELFNTMRFGGMVERPSLVYTPQSSYW